MSSNSLPVREESFSGRLGGPVSRPLTRFLAQEASSGVLLLIATAAALLWANFGGDSYFDFWHTEVGLTVGDTQLFEHSTASGPHPLSLELWVNDALMVLFFFVVGLEIKTELVVGELRNPRAAALPAIAALGGMVIPALAYVAVNLGGEGSRGWGVPMATDIAFAVGILALMGNRVPKRLPLFLLTLAIVDDIGAIAVIAIFYTADRSMTWLILAISGLVAIALMRRLRIWYTPLYVMVGIFVWYATFRSGVHATIAGVAVGLLTPVKPLLGTRRFETVEDIISGDTADPNTARDAKFRIRESTAVSARLITLLSPWTSFFVIPVFALANAGIPLSGDVISDAATSRVTLGVILGLVVGKPVGIFVFSMLAVRFKVATLPPGITPPHVGAVGALAGIGFTVALFISGLAFESEALSDQATIGILVASFLAAVVGWVLISFAPRPEVDTETPAADSPQKEPAAV